MLRLMKATQLTFSEVTATAQALTQAMKGYAWVGKTHCLGQPSFLESQVMINRI